MTVEPNIEEVGRIRAKTMVTKMINKAINDQFLEEADTESLLIRQTNEKGETTMEGIFASGDVVTGAKTVVEAVKYSKMIADVMDEYVKKKHGEE